MSATFTYADAGTLFRNLSSKMKEGRADTLSIRGYSRERNPEYGVDVGKGMENKKICDCPKEYCRTKIDVFGRVQFARGCAAGCRAVQLVIEPSWADEKKSQVEKTERRNIDLHLF